MEQNKNSKIKRNLLHTVITWAIIVAVLAANIGFSILSDRYLLRLDMSNAKYHEISPESEALLKELNPEENNITIYFLADVDELRSVAKGYSATYYKNQGVEAPTNNLWGMKYVYDIAQEFARKYDFVQIKHLSLTKNAAELEAFRSTIGTNLTKQDVIVDNYTSEKDANGKEVLDEGGNPVMHHNFRIIKRDAFFSFDSESYFTYAFRGDLQFTSTILSLAGANPTVYFVSGHGEPIGDYKAGDFSSAGDYGEAQALRDLFFDAGFVTKKIDLTKEYETLFADESARIIVLYGPTADYTGDAAYKEGGVSEIDVLRRFLVEADHHMMVFLGETEKPLDNLEEYLYDYWGVSFDSALIKDSGKNSLTDDGLRFFGSYETDQYSVGVNLTNQLAQLDSLPRAAFDRTRPITLDERFTQSVGYSEMFASLSAGAVFLAPEDTGLVDYKGNSAGDADQTGRVLAALTYEGTRNDNNEELSTYVFACGGTGFASNELLDGSSYSNRDVLYYTMRLMSRDTVPFEIDFKVMDSEGLDDIDEEQATAWTIVLCSLVPLAALVMGTVVFIRRRHS